MTQDTKLKNQGQWLFTKYDAFGRVVYTGQTNHSQEREELQRIFNNAAKKYEARKRIASDAPTNIKGTDVYYTNDSPPTGIAQVHTINYYDDYAFDREGLTVPTEVFDQSVDTRTKTLATGSKTKVLGTAHWITTINAYDNKGRVIYTATKNPYLNTTDIVEHKLDFAGKVLETRTTHTRGSNAPIVTTDKFEYDHAGRLVRQLQCINGDCGGDTTGENPVFDDAITETQHEIASNSITLKPGFHFKATGSISFSASISPAGELIAENVYDDLGQLKEKKVGNTQSKPLQTVNYTYNVRGWLKAINNPDAALGEQLFAFGIRYNDPAYNPADRALYNGNISETYWRTANDDQRRNYRYTYDALNRITGATNTGAGEYTRYELKNVAYDKNGNITDLTRNGWQNSSNYDNMDVLDYRYNSTNKLLKVIDTGNKSYGFKDGTNTNNDYTYDVNGNLTSDGNKGITGVSYNHLNLPTQISFGSNKIDYIYDASGTKLKKAVTEGSSVTTTEYAGKYIYENGSLAFFGHPEGYVTKENNAYKHVYQYKDHLGNVRLSYTNIGTTSSPQLEIIEENNYYPFGLEHKGYNNQINGPENNYMTFNGKELDLSLNLNVYDLGARQYDPTIGRFMVIDPMADFVNYQSPYVMADNNPIANIDEYGLGIFNVIGNLFRRLKNGVSNLFSGGCNCRRVQESVGDAWRRPDFPGVNNFINDLFSGSGRSSGKGKPSTVASSGGASARPQVEGLGVGSIGLADFGSAPVTASNFDISLPKPPVPSIRFDDNVRQIPAGRSISVPTRINFSGKDGTILAGNDNVNNRTLNAIVKTLQDYPQLKLFMYVNHITEASARSRGIYDENRHHRIVSERAAAIIRFLERKGIDPGRIKWDFDPKKFETRRRPDNSIRDDQKFELRNN